MPLDLPAIPTVLAASLSDPSVYKPLLILAAGIATVLGMILILRINAFIALISAAMVVSVLSGPAIADAAEPLAREAEMKRVATAFGIAAGNIGIVIGLAAVIGECMMYSGAADKIVRSFLKLLGQKFASVALMASGYVLSVPVFFDTVFYLLVPLARSLFRRTNQNYLLYLMAIAAGGAVTHTLVPPTPGPLLMAANLNISIGAMILVGALVAAPAAVVGILFSSYIDRVVPVPYRQVGTAPDPKPLEDHELPPLSLSLLPVFLPVLMISLDTVVSTFGKGEGNFAAFCKEWSGISATIGNPNFALLVATAIAIFLLWHQKRPTAKEMSEMIETSLMSGGAIILITAGGGAFGGMLKVAQIGDAIKSLFAGADAGGPAAAAGFSFLVLGFGVAVLLKVAQGSSTVAMITASGMLGAMNPTAASLGFHPVYLATAIGAGSLVGSWMNDSGFWIFAKMGGLTEGETLKSWSLLLLVLGITCFVVTCLLAIVMPLAG